MARFLFVCSAVALLQRIVSALWDTLVQNEERR